MCFTMYQLIVRSSTLQCITVYSYLGLLQCNTVYYSILEHITLYYSLISCAYVLYSVLQ